MTAIWQSITSVSPLVRARFSGLIGPNGVGKTTIMRCLSGLISATSGSLKIADCCVQSNLNTLKNRLAYVPDDPPLFDDLSVGEHLEFTGRLYRVPDHHDKAIELLQLFELLNKYKAGATALSRGMRQKLAVCCAYLYSPFVILLDEPLTGLAPQPFAPYSSRLLSCLDSCTPVVARDALNLIFRQAISVRHYRFNIAVSLLLTTALCLSPLFTGRIIEQWFYVAGGNALCTILLAPTALRIDFQRGLKRMVIVIALYLLVLWAKLCRNLLPEPYASGCYVLGSIAATWLAGLLGLAAATLCWRRFDIAIDASPE